MLVEVIYEEIGDYYKGVTWARSGESFGLVIDGKFKAIDGVDKIWDFEKSDLTYARKGKKIGFIDTKGNWVIEPKFDKAKAFVKGLAPVAVGKKWGYVNTSGKIVIEPNYNDAEIFSEDGLAPVKEGDWGFIDTTGKLVIPTNYAITAGGLGMFKGGDSKGFINGVARVKNNNKWGFIDKTGKVLGNTWYDNAELFQK